MPSNLVTSLTGVGPQVAERLERIGIRTVTDLLLHMPRDFQDRSHRTRLADVGEDVCVVQGEIIEARVPKTGRGYEVVFRDESGKGSMRLVNYHRNQLGSFQVGKWLNLYGKPSFARTFFHPQYRIFDSDPGEPKPEFRAIYAATTAITSARIATWILDGLNETAFFPKFEHDGQTLADAVRAVHQPDAATFPASVARSLARVQFDEMLAFVLLQRRRKRADHIGEPLPAVEGLEQRFLANLGFTLTNAQQRVAEEVLTSLEKPVALRRLVQGDVGSGKTVIAALAAIRATENASQTAIMAPTELLAEQHFQVFSEWLTPLGVEVGVLTSRMPAAKRRNQQDAIASGQAQVVVGTHALFQEKTQFKNLALTIIDEQHRFGVHQRMQMTGKGANAHQLVLTATPIPRTLALTMFDDLDISTIDEMPPGRIPIKTSLHAASRRDEVIEAVARLLRNGKQVYWVCVAIDEKEESELVASTTTYEQLTNQISNVGIAHVNGRLKVDEKNKIMTAFRDGDVRLLVATTVIEVGIDVSNATVMVIENAERLGLAQLHQLRGRVGRGSEQSFCLLLHNTPLGKTATKRLEAMRDSTDGFKLAEVDLETRGMGQMFGKKQSGVDPFRVASLPLFLQRFDEIRAVADRLLDEQPALAEAIVSTWTPEGQGYAAS